MKIYIVAKMVESETPSSTTIGAYADRLKAVTAAEAIDHQGITDVYGIVETVELDLAGLMQDQLDELRNAVS